MHFLFTKLSLFPPRNPNLLNPSVFIAGASLSPMAASKVVAEYAKSNRSSCKSCGKSIASGSLRLGLSSKDPRGFDLVKWHHLGCFPTRPQPFKAADEIKGFPSLKDCDQDALRKLEAAASSDEPVEKEHKRDRHGTDGLERNTKKVKIYDRDSGGSEEFEQKSLEEVKRSGDSMENLLEVAFSVSDIRKTYKDATLSPNWKSFQTVIFREREDGLNDSEKIAAFDFDGCLVNTSVKRIGANAWSLMHSSIPDKLQELYKNGYKLVIFTNESNIERWKNKRQQAVDSKIGRLDNFIGRVKVPIQVFIACGIGKNKDQTEDPFRKPKPGMWILMAEHFNSGIAIDLDQSFYVGDAAGRVNDHSDADIKFAQTLGLKFHLPEEFFGA
ncbi:uncharacterized protein A4U43_C05F17400 [Asparagus officinalis]|uniref:PARP-type domain-containing protein n=1 Tax=Asparagus officinalis TaxID=4686 RepID=A0A5P1EW60_ASPOF|nr:polynucleotide 3'-phosphatase ZDP isoform X2 [Asparagus officinalis]ONK68919.1 uncharacterized protein A4U43_C05F17400 [Asparagus officinalis]